MCTANFLACYIIKYKAIDSSKKTGYVFRIGRIVQKHQWEGITHAHPRQQAKNGGALICGTANITPANQPLPLPFARQPSLNFGLLHPVARGNRGVRVGPFFRPGTNICVTRHIIVKIWLKRELKEHFA
jgi:hypothetical protein